MFSTLLELLGFAAITAGTYLVGHLPAALFVAGGLLVLCGYAAEDESAVVALRRTVIASRRAASVLHRKPKAE